MGSYRILIGLGDFGAGVLRRVSGSPLLDSRPGEAAVQLLSLDSSSLEPEGTQQQQPESRQAAYPTLRSGVVRLYELLKKTLNECIERVMRSIGHEAPEETRRLLDVALFASLHEPLASCAFHYVAYLVRIAAAPWEARLTAFLSAAAFFESLEQDRRDKAKVYVSLRELDALMREGPEAIPLNFGTDIPSLPSRRGKRIPSPFDVVYLAFPESHSGVLVSRTQLEEQVARFAVALYGHGYDEVLKEDLHRTGVLDPLRRPSSSACFYSSFCTSLEYVPLKSLEDYCTARLGAVLAGRYLLAPATGAEAERRWFSDLEKAAPAAEDFVKRHREGLPDDLFYEAAKKLLGPMETRDKQLRRVSVGLEKKTWPAALRKLKKNAERSHRSMAGEIHALVRRILRSGGQGLAESSWILRHVDKRLRRAGGAIIARLKELEAPDCYPPDRLMAAEQAVHELRKLGILKVFREKTARQDAQRRSLGYLRALQQLYEYKLQHQTLVSCRDLCLSLLKKVGTWIRALDRWPAMLRQAARRFEEGQTPRIAQTAFTDRSLIAREDYPELYDEYSPEKQAEKERERFVRWVCKQFSPFQKWDGPKGETIFSALDQVVRKKFECLQQLDVRTVLEREEKLRGVPPLGRLFRNLYDRAAPLAPCPPAQLKGVAAEPEALGVDDPKQWHSSGPPEAGEVARRMIATGEPFNMRCYRSIHGLALEHCPHVERYSESYGRLPDEQRAEMHFSDPAHIDDEPRDKG